jgi:hypothetical protein
LTPLKSVDTGLPIKKFPETSAVIKKLENGPCNDILAELGEDMSGATGADKRAKVRRAIGLREYHIEGA